MLKKRALRALLVLWMCFVLTPHAFAQEIDGTSLTPPDIIENGITVHKSAVQRSPHVFDVTLTVTADSTIAPHRAVDLVVLLDCSADMGEASGDTTRIAAAQKAVLEMLQTLLKANVRVNIGLVGYSGTAVNLLDMTSLSIDTGNGFAENTQAVDAVSNAIKTLWSVAGEPGTQPTNMYGIAGGRNLSAALSQGVHMLNEQGTSSLRYCINITSGAPDVYGIEEKRADETVPPERYLSQEELAAATIADAQQAQQSMSRLFAVGLDTSELTAFASPDAAITATTATIMSVLESDAQRMIQRVQTLQVEDAIGNRFLYEEGTAKSDLGIVSISAEGHSLIWDIGMFLTAGQTATLTYTIGRNDPQLEAAGRVVPLSVSTVLRWNELADSGALSARMLSFPIPTTMYATGTLQVFSTGLPDGIIGTKQTVENTCIDCTGFFAVEPPIDAPDNYVLQEVAVDGALMTPAAFTKTYLHELATKPGNTVIEYRYAQATAQESDAGVLNSEQNKTLPAKNTVTKSAENQVKNLPLNAVPLKTSAQLTIESKYYLNNQTVEGTARTTVPVSQGTILVSTLLNKTYDNKEYEPVSVTMIRTVTRETEEKLLKESIPLTGSVVLKEDSSYIVETVFNRTVAASSQDEVLAQITPSKAANDLSRRGINITVLNVIVGMLAACGSVLLHKIPRNEQ